MYQSHFSLLLSSSLACRGHLHSLEGYSPDKHHGQHALRRRDHLGKPHEACSLPPFWTFDPAELPKVGQEWRSVLRNDDPFHSLSG